MGQRYDELIEKADSVPALRRGTDRTMVAHKAEGPRVFDVDSVGYIDYIGAGGATIVGFANQFVLDAVRKVLNGGVPEGFHVPQEVELANTLNRFLPWVTNWWFCRSQDDAFRHVLHWARQTTGKERLLVLDGGAPLRVGESVGLTGDEAGPFREVRGWDVARIIAAITSGSSKLAALILDPLMGRFGVVPPPEGVLEEIAEACHDSGVPLIMDERVAGFRVHRGGASARAGVIPDAAVYGAALGGGFPIGAIAFRDAQPPLDGFDRLPTPHPVALGAADAILSILKNDAVYEQLEKRTGQLVEGLLELADRFGRAMTINRVGSVFAVYLTDQPVVDRAGLDASDQDGYRKLAALLRSEGILVPREPGRAAFVSSTHGAKDIEETLAACEKALQNLEQVDSA
ncbi:MAG: aminotransferase class III-fold pyridoxal phosphate-dependent enzyme [Acidobacteria bacterium]|jgi:glutamate-1-semialdehyde 2,1-aminomutase|nr:aminotransferase class III-fold pyridoxal phosphate-dependent enzyme [Acidobacteriota bacterium]